MGGVLRDLARGFGAAALTVLVALLLPAPLRAPIVGVLLGVAAGVYPGFALGGSHGPVPASERSLQWVVALLFGAVAVVGIAVSAWWLMVGWVLHTAWDARHHAGRHGDWVPDGYPMFCLSYDLVLAAFAAWLALGGPA